MRLSASIFLGVLTVATVARAETVSIDTSSITRINPDKTPATSRTVEGAFQGVGFTDCTGNTSFVFNVAIGGFSSTTVSSYDLEVWVGTGDCTGVNATHNGSASCWPVIQSLVPSTPVAVTVRVEDLVSSFGISPPAQTYTAATVNACSTAKNALTATSGTNDAGQTVTTPGEATLNVFFMLFPIGGATTPAAASPAYPIKVRLTGPDAVTNLTAATGNKELVASWTAPSDIDIAGYDVYSELAGGGDAGCGTTIDTTTATLTVVSGGTSTAIPNLMNNSSYVIAVGAFDSFGNIGALSSVACGTPSAINDFWTAYNDDGGRAPGCSLGASSASALGIGVVVIGLALARQKKKQKRNGR